MKIGNVSLENNLILAPMAGITDKSYRVLAKRMGAGLVFTEMVSAKGIYYKDKKTNQLMSIEEEERPVGLQIFGSDPEIMASVVKTDINNREDIDIVDINMGCPAPKIVKNNDGSALMKDPELIQRIIYEVVQASEKPVTVKMRMGWDHDSLNAIKIGKIAEREGASAVTIHGRTKDMFYSGVADWDYIAEMKSYLDIPLIGNGDVFTPEDALNMFEKTKCDGIAIGRGAMGNPWIFRRILNVMDGNEDIEPSYKEVIEMINLHMDMICEDKGEYIGVKEMRKHISWYLKGMPEAKSIRNDINKIETKDGVKTILIEYLENID